MDLFKITDSRFQLNVPLMKYDERTGEFEGWATVEQLDKSGETCDVEKSWPHFKAWSDTFAKATDGENFGNVREQHDPKKSAGKLTSIDKQVHSTGVPGIYVKGVAVDPSTREKLVKRVLVGLSIGGTYVEKSDDGRYVANPSEISLVDNPCVPDAMITVVKTDGAEELAKAVGWLPSEQLWKCRAFGAGCLGHVKKDDARVCEVTHAELVEAPDVPNIDTPPAIDAADTSTIEDAAKAASIAESTEEPKSFIAPETDAPNTSEVVAPTPTEKVTAPETAADDTLVKVADLEKTVATQAATITELQDGIKQLNEMVKRFPTRAKGQLRTVTKAEDATGSEPAAKTAVTVDDVFKAALNAPKVLLPTG